MVKYKNIIIYYSPHGMSEKGMGRACGESTTTVKNIT